MFVAASAGNDGPGASTVAHNSPWLTTVAATTHDNFDNTVVLGNGAEGHGRLDRRRPGAVRRRWSTPRTCAVAGADADDASAVRSRHPRPGQGHRQDRGLHPRRLRPRRQERRGRACRRRRHGAGQPERRTASTPTSTRCRPIHITTTGRRGDRGLHRRPRPTATATHPARRHHRRRVDAAAADRAASPRAARPLANDGDLLKPDISAPGVSVLAAVAPPANREPRLRPVLRHVDGRARTSPASPRSCSGSTPTGRPMMVKSAMMTTAIRRQKDRRTAPSTTRSRRAPVSVDPEEVLRPGSVRDLRRRDSGVGFLPARVSTSASGRSRPTDLNGPSIAQGQVTAEHPFTRTFIAPSARAPGRCRSSVPGFEATPDTPTLVVEARPVTSSRSRSPSAGPPRRSASSLRVS